MRPCGAISSILLLVCAVSLSACAIVQIEKSGEVVERHVVFGKPTRVDAAKAEGSVSRVVSFGLAQTPTATTLGYTSATVVHIGDPSKCSLVVVVRGDSTEKIDLLALQALMPGACVVNTN
ncbi:MAG: hypothetical protein EAZ43_07855 [Betaproteobacteria bacterium]|nr:MAG: hypothetical protein EAZ43_07855 [Betaproteobacteria bacterium]